MVQQRVPNSYLRPEGELITYCARTCIDSKTAERIKELLGEELDWAYLLQMAHWHAVMPLLSWHLNQICAEAIPKPTRTYLRDYFHQNMRRNLYLTGELLKILKLFGGNGIQAVPFKGPTLASIAYQNLGLRQYTDLDLLVQNHDVPKAKALLLSQGYQPSFHLTQAREMAYLAYQSEYGFTRTKDGVIVELHWGMAPKYFSFQFDAERLWSRLQRISIGGAEVLTLPPEDLLLALCVEGAKDLWGGLGRICDIAELIRHHREMHWHYVMEQAEGLGAKRMLLLALYLAHDYLGAALPEEVLQWLQVDPVVKSLAAKIRQRLFPTDQDEPGLLERCLFQLRMRERLPDRIRYCFRLTLTPTLGDWQFLPLPESLSCFYYLVRPVRLACKYGGLAHR